MTRLASCAVAVLVAQRDARGRGQPIALRTNR